MTCTNEKNCKRAYSEWLIFQHEAGAELGNPAGAVIMGPDAILAGLKRLKRERDEAMLVLQDKAEETIGGWLAEVVKNRETLVEGLREASIRQEDDEASSGPADEFMALARLIGGPEETERQVAEAREQAELEDTGRTAAAQMEEARRARPNERHTRHCWASLAWGHGECICSPWQVEMERTLDTLGGQLGAALHRAPQPAQQMAGLSVVVDERLRDNQAFIFAPNAVRLILDPNAAPARSAIRSVLESEEAARQLDITRGWASLNLEGEIPPILAQPYEAPPEGVPHQEGAPHIDCDCPRCRRGGEG